MTSSSSSPIRALPIRVGAEPLSIDGGSVGVVLSHGFTGSPASMKPWGQYLADQGFSVRVPRLPGHGTTWKDMNTTRWHQWYGELDAAVTDLKATCDQVAVCGLSMGGALVLRLAQQRPDDIAAVVVVNPAVASARFDVKLVPALQHVVPSMPGIGNDIKLPGQDEIGYDKTPLKALASMMQMWKGIRADMDQVRAPLLYFRSTEDHVVDDSSTPLIRENVSSPVNDFVTLDNSFHVATLDHDAPVIFERSAAFIREHTGLRESTGA